MQKLQLHPQLSPATSVVPSFFSTLGSPSFPVTPEVSTFALSPTREASSQFGASRVQSSSGTENGASGWSACLSQLEASFFVALREFFVGCCHVILGTHGVGQDMRSQMYILHPWDHKTRAILIGVSSMQWFPQCWGSTCRHVSAAGGAPHAVTRKLSGNRRTPHDLHGPEPKNYRPIHPFGHPTFYLHRKDGASCRESEREEGERERERWGERLPQVSKD